MMELVDGKCHGTFHCANVDRIGCRTVTDKVTEEECDWLSQVVLSHNKRMSTILGLCTAKADFGRYLKLSVQLCVTATQLSQNLLKQLPHRKWLSHCAVQVGLQAVLSHATQLSQHLLKQLPHRTIGHDCGTVHCKG